MFQIQEVWKQRIGYTSFGLTKNSPYKIFLNKAFKKIYESGQLSKILQKWENTMNKCSSRNQVSTLGFEKLISVSMIIGLGIVLSLIMISCERIAFMRGLEKAQNDEVIDKLKIDKIRKLLVKKRKTDLEIISLLKDT